MKQTRMNRVRSNNTTRKHNFCCEATIKSLHGWYKAEFEKLGWMILAKNKGMHEKVMTYKHSLNHLKDAIIHRWKGIHDKDRKTDLEIMLRNVEILIEHAEKDFGM
jgi:hypothetical protein